MKTLIAIILCTWMFSSNAQEPLYELKIKGSHANYATGTQTVLVGRVFTTVDGNTSPVTATITIKGYDKDVIINENGNYLVEISDVIKSKKKIVVSCKAKKFKAQEQVIKPPFTNEYHINFDLVPKSK